MRRKLILAVLILLAFVLQGTVFQTLSIASIVPNLLLILTVSFGFMRGKKEGMFVGFFCGLLIDIFYGSMIGFSREEIDAKLQSILDFADIGDFVYQPVKTYSSGMFVRLAFAVAINIDPEILIVDEALSVGDVFFQAKCYRKFEEFKKMGKTILLVTHDPMIASFCKRIIFLKDGQVIENLKRADNKEMFYQEILKRMKNL